MKVLAVFSAFLASTSLVSATFNYGGKKFKNIVAFGDSFTDEGRLNYFGANNGQAPPPGYIFPPSNSTATGGKSWARLAAELTGAKLYNYAVSGAVCSNKLTPRTFGTINAPFPSVLDYEVPAFKEDNKRFFKLNMDQTLFALWIGTNDLGANALLTHEQLHGVSLTNVTSCMYDVLSELRSLGAKNFAILNVAPLQLFPLYQDARKGGIVGDNRFWAGKGTQGANTTLVSEDMRDLVWSANEILKYMIPARTAEWKWRGARVATLDAYSLMSEIYYNPQRYLTGPKPLNVTGHVNHCNVDWSVCFNYRDSDRDSFVFYDELHPSEITSKVVAKEFVKVVTGGRSKYGSWL